MSGFQSLSAEISAGLFRQVVGRFGSGVTAVTGMAEGAPVGLACQSFFSVSLDPPLIAISPSRTSTSWAAIAHGGRFGVSILSSDQEDACLKLGRRGDNKFDGVAWHTGESGVPLIDGALGWLECDIDAVHPGGDHHLVVGRVRSLGYRSDGTPLIFSASSFARLAPRRRKAPDLEWDGDSIWGSGPWPGTRQL